MKNSETLMLQDVWRQAWRKPEGLELTFKTPSGAHRARMQLYNAVKEQKAGRDMEDLELVHAAEGLEIVWGNEAKTQLRMQRRDKSDMMEGISAALGKTAKDYVDPAAQEMAERMLKELGTPAVSEEPKTSAPPAEHRDNPFYGKRG